MTLSKKNLDQLKSIFKKEDLNINKNTSEISTQNDSSFSKNESLKSNNPSDIFYSIIDNSDHLEDTTLRNKKLIESEDNLIKDKSSHHITNQINTPRNNQLTEEDLLYDEFNYRLDEE